MLEEKVKKEGEMKKAPCLSSNHKDNFIIELSEVVKKQMVWLLPNGPLLSASSSMYTVDSCMASLGIKYSPFKTAERCARKKSTKFDRDQCMGPLKKLDKKH